MSPPNIWVAAADGDLARVQELVGRQAVSPNAPDAFTYTPMHAAASYGQLHVLAYLIAQGGDVNITDSDGDTPLYTVENIATARLLTEHGAVTDRRNAKGVSPIEHLEEDFPDVAAYLRTLSAPAPAAPAPPEALSQHQQNAASEHLTAALMSSVQDIMQRAEAEGRDPDDELRQAVSRTVLEGVATGFQMSADSHDVREDGVPPKRPRLGE